WIIVALSSTLIYPQLTDIGAAFPYVDKALIGHDMAYPAMMRFLPAGALGFVIAGVLAAYRSTIETHLNWGTSYLVHDLYRRFLRPGKAETHYVLAGRLTTAGLMVIAALMTYALGTAKEAFDLILSIGAGTGLLYLLRWFWWRVSAWSEISAMVGSFVVALAFFVARKNGAQIPEDVSLIVNVATTSVIWVAVTLFGPQNDRETLVKFYSLVKPGGPGWEPIRAASGVQGSPESPAQALAGWVLGCLFVYSALFGVGSLLYGRMPQFYVWGAVFVASGFGMWRVLRGFWAGATTD
ncbi:MAG: Na+:solute symporter, partial [Gemmatimonadota bacterium]|nr:Na+:solute symporter [Gemmatimonadota bacterium]